MSNVVYQGIDFANKKANHGECWILDDGRGLSASFRAHPAIKPTRIAVDCPLGTTYAFERLLRGEVAVNESVDVFKSRASERLLREVVAQYQINRDWQGRSKADRKRLPRASFFNGGSHVQPTIGMVIVPEVLAWLADQAGTATETRQAALIQARTGQGQVVEAHPRLFLYSAVERLRLSGVSLTLEQLDDVAGYKAEGDDGKARRLRVFDMLKSHPLWLGRTGREIHVDDLDGLSGSDHAFDAWLSALTAWAHQAGETWTWQQTRKIEPHIVEVEGHILILRNTLE